MRRVPWMSGFDDTGLHQAKEKLLQRLSGMLFCSNALLAAQIRTGLLLSNSLDTLRDMTSKDWLSSDTNHHGRHVYHYTA